GVPRDAALAGRRVHEGGIVREEPKVVWARSDLPKIRAPMAPCSMGSSYDFPVRFSKTVSVSLIMKGLLAPPAAARRGRRNGRFPQEDWNARRAQHPFAHAPPPHARDPPPLTR